MIMLDCRVNYSIPLIVSDHRLGGSLAAEEFIRSGSRYVLHLCNEAAASHVISYESYLELERILEEHNILKPESGD